MGGIKGFSVFVCVLRPPLPSPPVFAPAKQAFLVVYSTGAHAHAILENFTRFITIALF